MPQGRIDPLCPWLVDNQIYTLAVVALIYTVHSQQRRSLSEGSDDIFVDSTEVVRLSGKGAPTKATEDEGPVTEGGRYVCGHKMKGGCNGRMGNVLL